MNEQALSGISVLDFGQYIAGPYAAMLLAEQEVLTSLKLRT